MNENNRMTPLKRLNQFELHRKVLKGKEEILEGNRKKVDRGNIEEYSFSSENLSS